MRIWVSTRLATTLHGGKLYGAPELVIEVLSPGTKNINRDRTAKLGLYSRRGVDEYWITDWPQHRVEVYRRENGQLVLVTTLGPVLLPSPAPSSPASPCHLTASSQASPSVSRKMRNSQDER
ncbi:MAG: Uma2 family endonuclease [Chloroflexia bacterium]